MVAVANREIIAQKSLAWNSVGWKSAR